MAGHQRLLRLQLKACGCPPHSLEATHHRRAVALELARAQADDFAAFDHPGIYLDGAPYERAILRKLRAALEPLTATRRHPFLLDLHASCAGNPHLPYAELYPYLDSIWFGEQCEYQTYSPEQWLAEVSGVPFGLPGQVLGDNREQWQALVFGMTCRIYPDPHRCNPRPLWAALDALGMQSPRMVGWWDAATPIAVVGSGRHGGGGGGGGGGEGGGGGGVAEVVRATLFVGETGAAIAVANWARHPVSFSLQLDWGRLAALGVAGSGSGSGARLVAPAIEGFQEGGEWAATDELTLQAKGGGRSEGLLLKIVATAGGGGSSAWGKLFAGIRGRRRRASQAE